MINERIDDLMRDGLKLIQNTDILLLDEAMSALDYQTRLTISDDIYKIIKKEGKTAIMVTHDLEQAVSMSDRVIVLSKRPAKIKSVYEINLTNKSTPTKNIGIMFSFILLLLFQIFLFALNILLNHYHNKSILKRYVLHLHSIA